MRYAFSLIPLFLAGSISCLAAVDEGLLALAPADSKLIASIDISSASRSEFGQYFLKRIDSEDRDLQDFTAETGFDPRRDLEHLLFTSSSPSGEGRNSRGVILARGSFDTNRLKALAQAKGANIERYQGVVLLINKEDKTALAFPEVGTAVLGDPETVRSVIAHRSSPTALEPQLARRIESVGSANDVWFVSPSGAQFLANAGAQFNNNQALQSILQSSGGIHFGETVRLSLDAATRSPEDANSLAAVIRFLGNMVQAKDQNNPDLAIVASALSRMDLQVKGANLHISLSVSEKNLEQIAQLQSKHVR